jgi:hypothetical protein
VPLEIIDDEAPEPAETFVLTLSATSAPAASGPLADTHG